VASYIGHALAGSREHQATKKCNISHPEDAAVHRKSQNQDIHSYYSIYKVEANIDRYKLHVLLDFLVCRRPY
jgi:hypothetical protein